MCPGCGSVDIVIIGPSGPGFVTTLQDREFVQPPYEARRCRQCQLVFKSVIAAPSVLADYYSRVDFRKWEIPGLFPTEEAVLAVLADLAPQSRVLDFGCSTGRLLSRVVGQFRCYGVEINADAAREAEKKGLRMVNPATLFEHEMPTRYDAVVAVDLVEHLTEPTDLLTKLSEQIVPGGRLILSTGDADSPAARHDPANFWYFRNIEHLCMFTRKYAEFLAARLGLELIRWDRMSHYRQTLRTRTFEWAQTLAFEVFHRGRFPWFRPLLSVVPGFRRARHWASRPSRTGTVDHVLAVFRKPR